MADYIAAPIVPLAPACNERASQWRWEVNLLGRPQATLAAANTIYQ